MLSHAITLGDILAILFIGAGLILAGFGLLAIFAGGMSDDPSAGSDATGLGCISLPIGVVLLGLAAFLLVGCAHTSSVAKVQTIEVKIPVAVQPITKAQIPPLPPQLGPMPPDARDGEAVALAGRCEAISFILRAYPLLLLSAGLPPAQAPDYPECAKH